MKKLFLFLSIFFIIAMACDLAVNITAPASPASLPTNTPAIVEMPTQALATPVVEQPAFAGEEIAVDPLHINLSPELAGGARGIQFPRTEGGNVPPWDLTPGHTVLKLEAYILQGKFHEPQIHVYPASGYAEMYPAAFESMHRLNNIFASTGSAISADQLPLVPFFNAGQVFASHVQKISFQNGQGVRFLTQYAQAFVPVNNMELFYHFQGLTSDGAYYIVAILPVSAPVLPETSDAGAVLPAGGVPFPDMANPSADFQGYYGSVTDLLNATPPDAFTPALGQLDQLIQSIRVTP